MEGYGDDSTGPLTVEGRDFGHFPFFCFWYAIAILIVNFVECSQVGLHKYKKGKESSTENVTS